VGKNHKKIILSKRQEHKIIIIGNIHGRQSVSKEKYDMKNSFEDHGVIKLGGGLVTITNTTKEDILKLAKKEIEHCKAYQLGIQTHYTKRA
jgi:hypothetical protein